jgi:septum formation protein
VIVLASTSPRRAALLAEAGIAFEALDPGVKDDHEEELARRWRALGPAAVARRLAIAKALAAAKKMSKQPPALLGGRVLAADTVVALGETTLGKPRDEGDARAMIELLAGKTHEVTTGVALLDLATGKLEAESETTRVAFNAMDAKNLDRFLASGTWAGKAGAYGVQDEAARPLVASVDGSRSNVVGLPIERVRALLGRVAVLLLLALVLAGCPKDVKNVSNTTENGNGDVAQVPSSVASESTNEPFVPDVNDGLPSTGLPEVRLTIKGTPVTVELAVTEAERRLGLMNRDGMADDRGMLFVYPELEKTTHNFWMKNTRIPLSLAYILDDGTIVNVEDMEAFDTTTKHPSKDRVRLALELNKGWFKIHGVRSGDRVEGITPEILARGE